MEAGVSLAELPWEVLGAVALNSFNCTKSGSYTQKNFF